MLHEYDLELKQILCITTDNGANMVKAVNLLNEHLNLNNTDSKEQLNNDEIQNHIDSISENVFVNSIRCATHTLQ